ncbi:helix-turn-helix transcriptional regulator [Candidatus Bipolaricaulota bacterium]|nr:helix-turn-helix transcriptional regulator [Candidatus Bipolaricaulota bacterium]
MPDRYAAFFKCFSAGSRNRMLQLLAEHGELAVEEIARRLGLKEPTVSRHLQLLRLHGLVNVRAQAQLHYYSINKERIAQQMRAFLDFLRIPGASP